MVASETDLFGELDLQVQVVPSYDVADGSLRVTLTSQGQLSECTYRNAGPIYEGDRTNTLLAGQIDCFGGARFPLDRLETVTADLWGGTLISGVPLECRFDTEETEPGMTAVCKVAASPSVSQRRDRFFSRSIKERTLRIPTSSPLRLPRSLIARGVESLPLSTGAKNALLRAGFTTLEDLDGLSANDLLVFSLIGSKRALEIYLAARWVAEDNAKQAPDGPPTVAKAGDSTQENYWLTVPPHLEEASIDSVNVRPSMHSALLDLGCGTLGDLEGITREDLLSLRGVREKGLDELESELRYFSAILPPSLARVCPHNGSGPLILPRVPRVVLDNVLRARSLGDEILALVADLSKRNAQLFLRRISLEEDRRPTLDELGREFGITRERVRQLNVARSQMLRESGLRLPLASSVVEEIDEAEGMLATEQLIEVLRLAGIGGRPDGSHLPSTPSRNEPDTNGRMARGLLRLGYGAGEETLARFGPTLWPDGRHPSTRQPGVPTGRCYSEDGIPQKVRLRRETDHGGVASGWPQPGRLGWMVRIGSCQGLCSPPRRPKDAGGHRRADSERASRRTRTV